MMNTRPSITLLLFLVMLGVSSLAVAQNRNFRTHLTGSEEVDPIGTRAQGQAVFQLSKDGEGLRFRLMVANIEDILQAHIHFGEAGENGPIVLWLYPAGPPAVLIEGRFNGVLAQGTVTEANLVGPLEGQPLSALIELMELGMAYVNVHTSENPGGEVRGQIK